MARSPLTVRTTQQIVCQITAKLSKHVHDDTKTKEKAECFCSGTTTKRSVEDLFSPLCVFPQLSAIKLPLAVLVKVCSFFLLCLFVFFVVVDDGKSTLLNG